VRIALFPPHAHPSTDVFSIFPGGKENPRQPALLYLVGFHIPRYANNFARSAVSLRAVKGVDPVPVRRGKFPSLTGSALAATVVCSLPDAMKGRACASSPIAVAPSPDQIRPHCVHSRICAKCRKHDPEQAIPTAS